MTKQKINAGFMLGEVFVVIVIMTFAAYTMTGMFKNNFKSIEATSKLSEVNYLYINLLNMINNKDFIGYSASANRNLKLRSCISPLPGTSCNVPTNKYEEFNLYNPDNDIIIAGTTDKPVYYTSSGSLCSSRATYQINSSGRISNLKTNGNGQEKQIINEKECVIRVIASFKALSCVGTIAKPPCPNGASFIGMYLTVETNGQELKNVGIKIESRTNKILPGQTNILEFPQFLDTSSIPVFN